ncbi:MAG: DUF2817 domain-containing protein [Candidatus ainarchaeum sp.]|nr:DUF2817 domain-containing protein [Candidatus ainarchaeum sp.]
MNRKYFYKNYFEARNKFIELSKKNKFEQENYKIEKNLTIDVSFKKTNKDKLIIFLSGVHGVEGYLGSGFQNLFLDKFFQKNKNKSSVLLIHSLNPYGYANNRRYNKNNVDLNRNNIENFKNVKNINPKYTEIFRNLLPVYNPKNTNFFTVYFYYYIKLFLQMIKYAPSDVINASGFGQNIDSKSVCYCGNKKEKETLILENILKKHTKEFKKVIFVDIHSGSARKYEIATYTNYPEDSKEIKLIKKIWKNTKSRFTKARAMNHIGSVEDSFYKNCKSKEKYDITLEYGTILRFSMIMSLSYLARLLVIENSIYNRKKKRKYKKIKRRMKEAYFPEDETYYLFFKKRTSKFIKRIYKYF